MQHSEKSWFKDFYTRLQNKKKSKSYTELNVFADYKIDGELKRNNKVKCFGYKKRSTKGSPYIRVRINLYSDYKKGDWINLVIKENK